MFFGFFNIFLQISRPMVDNDDENKYMYEILAFTGNKKGASCDSKVNRIPSKRNKKHLMQL